MDVDLTGTRSNCTAAQKRIGALQLHRFAQVDPAARLAPRVLAFLTSTPSFGAPALSACEGLAGCSTAQAADEEPVAKRLLVRLGTLRTLTLQSTS